MLTGKFVLKSIDQSLQAVRREALHFDKQLSNLTSNLASQQRQKVNVIQQIVAVRLSEIEQGELKESLTQADRKALHLLESRSQALEQLNDEIDELNESIIESEERRQPLLDKVNELSGQLVEIESDVQTALRYEKDYLDQFEKASRADAVLQESERKVKQAHEDMTAKEKPYKDDPLFMYLWERGFGTTEYKGKLIVRAIDSWVARVIKYEKSRVNFWNLTEIPKRLSEHAEHIADIAEKEHEALQKVERQALEKAGTLEVEKKIDTARTEIDSCDDTTEHLETELSEKLEERAAFTTGDDPYVKQAIDVLSNALKHDNLRSIQRYVRATHSPNDDRLVIQLEQIEDELEDVNDNLDDVRKLLTTQRSKLKELESIRRNFKNARYDDVRSGFTNQSLITNVLNQFLQGQISSANVWQTIQRNQRYRNIGASPQFGSGGLGRSLGNILINEVINQSRRGSRRSSWNIPSSRGGGGGSFRRPARKRSGGFTTGGGF